MMKSITYCPCCKSRMIKIDTDEYKCINCSTVFDIAKYSLERWENINSIMVDDEEE